jgi:hypothetical protein
LRRTARLSGFLRDAGRQLHGTGRSDELSGPCVRRFRVRFQVEQMRRWWRCRRSRDEWRG